MCEIGVEKIYKEINLGIRNSCLKRGDDYNDIELRSIINKIHSLGYDSIYKSIHKKNYLKLCNTSHNYDIKIHRCIDEWYIVTVNSHIDIWIDITKQRHLSTKWYKCDGEDGLMQFLNMYAKQISLKDVI